MNLVPHHRLCQSEGPVTKRGSRRSRRFLLNRSSSSAMSQFEPNSSEAKREVQMKTLKFLYMAPLALLMSLSTACSLMQQRHPASGYSSASAYEVSPFETSMYEESNYPGARDSRRMESRRSSAPVAPRREFASLIQEKDIAIGMDRESVRESWGDPREVHVAGNPSRQNERWTYVEFLPSPDGYQAKYRTLYFERGELVGWRSD